jgi:hypothetical protein
MTAVTTLLLFSLITTFLWYLGSAANITLPIREMLPAKVNSFLLCPACSGFWYGLGLGIYAHTRHLLPWPSELVIFGLAAASGTWTALGAGLLLRALSYRDEILSRGQEHQVGDVDAG